MTSSKYPSHLIDSLWETGWDQNGVPVTLSVNEAERLLEVLERSRVDHIASGMEGHVFDLGKELVAKVWFAASFEMVNSLRGFYDVLRSLDLPFRTPQIVEIHRAGETVVTFERRLPGTSLRVIAGDDSGMPHQVAVDAIVSIHAALRERPIARRAVRLPIVWEMPSTSRTGYPRDLIDVARRKIERFGDQLRNAVDDFDDLSRMSLEHAVSQAPQSPCIVHGDLVPPNILIGDDYRVSAVIDWGFLTHAGDPVFDISITTGIQNMYGQHQDNVDRYLVREVGERLGYNEKSLLAYRALYAMVTSNAYSEDGSDGHFGWCVSMLNRSDVREALGSLA